jgi:hypothetical protein
LLGAAARVFDGGRKSEKIPLVGKSQSLFS